MSSTNARGGPIKPASQRLSQMVMLQVGTQIQKLPGRSLIAQQWCDSCRRDDRSLANPAAAVQASIGGGEARHFSTTPLNRPQSNPQPTISVSFAGSRCLA